MQQTPQTNHYIEDEIYLKDIINQLLASKKLIIGITLLSTILALFYSYSKPPTFMSNALIEIGHYDLINVNKDKDIPPKYLTSDKKPLIEKARDLVQELNIFFSHKKQNGIHNGALSISIIEDRLIEIGTTSPSSEIGINSLNNITSYILNRHENIIIGKTQRNLNLINTNLEKINSEIEFNNGLFEGLKAALAKDIEEKIVILKNDINNINSEIEFNNKRLQAEKKKRIKTIQQLLPTIDKKIFALQLVILEDTENLRLLETDPQLLKERAAITPTLSEVIYLYKNSILDFESEKISLENELLILQDSISEIKMALENNSENSIYLIDMIDRKTYTDISSQLFLLSQEKNIQEKNLQLFMTQTPSNSALIGEISSSQSNPKIMKFTFQGFLFGMILSLVLALIIGKFKAYKEENAITL